MTYTLECMRDNPIGVWISGAENTLIDFSGRSPDAVITGSTRNYLPLMNGSEWSVVVESGGEVEYEYSRRYEAAYSIEAFVSIVVPPTQDVMVLGHKDADDGIIINGTTVMFTTALESTGSVTASYDISVAQNFHVVGVYDGGKNSLFINGVLVSETELSDAQRGDSLDTQENSLFTLGTGQIAVAGVAVYHHALSLSSVRRHYLAGIQSFSNDDVVARFNGQSVPLANEFTDNVLSSLWTGDDWLEGELLGFSINDDGHLLPEMIGGVTTGSYWLSAVDLGEHIARPAAVTITEDSIDAVIEYSVDGSTWNPVVGETRFSVTEIEPVTVELRATVSPGLTEAALVRSLSIDVSETGTLLTGDISVSMNSAIPQQNEQQNRMHANDGSMLTAGYLQVDADDSIMTIEVFARNMSSTSKTLLDLRAVGSTTLPVISSTGTTFTATGTAYVDGVAYGSPFIWPVGEWRLIHIVLSTALATTINIGKAYNSSSGSDWQIANVVLYPEALSSGTIADIFSLYFGHKQYRIGTSGDVFVSEPSDSVTTYAHNWSIQSAG